MRGMLGHGHVVVHEHPRAAVDHRRAVRLQRRLVHRARVALVGVERPRRVVLGVDSHLPVAHDLGEDAGGGDAEAAGVGPHPAGDVADVRRHEVPLAVDHGGVGDHTELVDRPLRRQALGRRHAELVALHLRGGTDPPRHAPRRDPANRRSRSRSVSSLESRMPLTRRSRGRIAAPTISGPAHAPRPTSSTPTTTSWPRSHISRSTDRVGARFLDTAGRTVAVTPRPSRSRKIRRHP